MTLQAFTHRTPKIRVTISYVKNDSPVLNAAVQSGWISLDKFAVFIFLNQARLFLIVRIRINRCDQSEHCIWQQMCS